MQCQAEVRTHAGAQHLGRPQRGRAGECQHLAHTEGCRAAQDAADVAGVLHAVEYEAGRSRDHNRRRGQVDDETDAGWRFERAETGEKRARHDGHLGRPMGQFPQRRHLPCRVADHRLHRGLAAGAQRAAQVVTLDPHLAESPVGATVLCQPAQAHQQGVVARDDANGPAHRWPSLLRTGAKLRRCAAQAPCSFKAARCPAVG